MQVDLSWLWALLLVFVRCAAMFLASPMFGGAVPARIRVLFCGAFAVCVVPTVQPHVAPIPYDLGGLALAVGHEVALGLLIGFTIQLLMLAVQMAGAVVDTQLGLNMMQLLNPSSGANVTLIAQFKFMLAAVMLFLMDGHHVMLQAFMASYTNEVTLSMSNLEPLRGELLRFLGALTGLAIQIAAPVAAVTFVVDAASGFVNKSIPQMPVTMVVIGAKTTIGILVLALGLPIMAVAVRTGIEHTGWHLAQIMDSGRPR